MVVFLGADTHNLSPFFEVSKVYLSYCSQGKILSWSQGSWINSPLRQNAGKFCKENMDLAQ